MTRLANIFLCAALLSCRHVQTKSASSEFNTDVSHDQHEAQRTEEKAKASTGKVKTVGPTETDEIDVTDLYGWAPPAPDAPKGTPYTWRPIVHAKKKSTEKAAGSVTETNTNSDTTKRSNTTTDTADKSKTGGKSQSSLRDETKFGLSWPVKLAIAAGSLIALIVGVALLKPAWLALPLRAFKWIAGLFKKKVTT